MTNEKNLSFERVNGKLILTINENDFVKFATFSDDGLACSLSLSGLTFTEKQAIDGVDTDVKYILSGTVSKRLPKPKAERKPSKQAVLETRVGNLEAIMMQLAQGQSQIINRLNAITPATDVKQIAE